MPTTTTEDRVAAHLATLQSSITELVTGEQWQRYLRVQARFHTYSFWNTLAILSARSNASRVAGFHQWRRLGRQVRKGERGIPILAPILRCFNNSILTTLALPLPFPTNRPRRGTITAVRIAVNGKSIRPNNIVIVIPTRCTAVLATTISLRTAGLARRPPRHQLIEFVSRKRLVAFRRL